MALQPQGDESDDGMDEFMDKFTKQKYKGAFSEDSWQEEFDQIPMFMKKAPEEIDPLKNPELACLQSIIHDEDRPPEEQARSFKDEGNEYFKEKNYKKAILSYTEGLRRKCADQGLNAVLLTNRAAAHFHLGNIRSSLNDALEAKKLKPDHLKAVQRGAQCLVELRRYTEALQCCDEGLRVDPQDKKLQELRATADQLRARNIKLLEPPPLPRRRSDEEEEEDEEGRALSVGLAELELDGLGVESPTGARVFLDGQGVLLWPVLFLYPEHQQTDFISAFSEADRFVDHLSVMFGDELPSWDTDRKYRPCDLQLYFEDEEKEELYEVSPASSLLEVLQHDRFFVKAGTPGIIVLVRGSAFCSHFLSGRRVHRLK
ncbi:tetratricopeptide repeat protein 4 isoform X2 [Amia ocellicauda]|uniref:tetratricopeptide repeat protein 4 isoform X2 n=1 Tax=Amia ocellicauda TaxID=2972642 RepID=UPI003463982D|nr:TTC4 protein [Amia calva]